MSELSLRGLLKRAPRVFLTCLALTFAALAGARAEAQTFPISQSVLDVDPGNTVLTGNPFRYRINYRCNSTVTNCAGAVLTWNMPPELVFVSALGTSDVASIASPGVGSNGPVTFTFDNPVPAGNTGDLDVTVRFPNGPTPNGTVTTGTTNNATATGSNFPNATASAPNVTGLASNHTTIAKSIPAGTAFLDQNVTYRIVIDPDSGANQPGSLNLTGVVVVDTLPAGVTFVSATNGGVYDGPSNTVTWDNGGAGFNVNVGSTLTLQVTVIFPTPTFSPGQQVTNEAEATVVPVGGAATGVGPAVLNHTVQQFVESPGASIDKAFGGGYVAVAIGQTFQWNVRARNVGNVPLDTLVVTDTVPPEVDVVSVSTGGYSAGYAGTVSLTYTTNLGGPFALGSSPGNTNATFPIPALGVGEYVTELEWSFTGPIPAGMDATTRAVVTATLLATANDGSPVNVGDTVENCLDLQWTATTMSGPASGNDDDCHSFTVSQPFTLSSPIKNLTSGGGPYLPGQTVSFNFDLDNQSQASADLNDPIVVDLLPAFFAYQAGSYVLDDNGTGMTVALFEELPDYAGTGRTLLRWFLSGTLAPGENVDLDFDTVVEVGAVAGQVTNQVGQTHDGPELIRCGTQAADTLDLDGDGSTSDLLCTANRNVTVASVAQLQSQKLVRGQCDTDYSFFPDYGRTVRGGTIDYRMLVTNVGTVPTTTLTIVDILPFVGDTGVLDLTPRDSGWRPLLIEPIEAPPGATVYYSTSGNPCRPEVGGPTSGCDVPNWSTVPPSPITAVQSFKVEFNNRILDPLDTLVFELRMIAPADAPIAVDDDNPVSGEIAWNSFGFGTNRVDGGFLNAEPLKVGIIVKPDAPASLGDFVWIDTDGDGVQDDGPTGVNDVPVTLYSPGPDNVPRSGDDLEISSTITADDLGGNPGWYIFTNLPPGDYYVRFTPPPGYQVTLPDQGGDDALDSDGDLVTACTPVVTLGPTDVDLDLDLGLLPPTTAALGNYVWFDSDADGLQDQPVTSGVNGVVVELYADADGDGTAEPGAADGPAIGVTSTADDGSGNPGYYLFDDLPPGGYFVRFVLPAGASGFTVANAGGDDVVDSDADTGTGVTAVTVLAAGDVDLTLDAGLVQVSGPLTLGNQVWCDDDNDGVYEPGGGELGVDGVHLNLYRDDNGDGLPQPGEFFGATTTQTLAGQAGRYLFSALPAGAYVVEVEASNFQPGEPLEGKISSTGNDPAPDPDDDVNSDDNGRNFGVLVLSAPVSLTVGGEPTNDGDGNNGNLTVDFGFQTGSLPFEFDYGDAPDAAAGTAHGDYNTRALDGGPFHALVVPQPFLGDCVDSDNGSQQGVAADRDDVGSGFIGTLGSCAGAGDDEDGVAFANPLTPGASVTFTVSAGSVGGSVDCRLDAWVDWNQDGVFDDAGEAIAASTLVAAGGSINLNPTVPAAALPGLTYARFRCSSAGGLDPVEPALDGEVEDYLVRVLGRDLGDAPASYGTQGGGAAAHTFDPGVDPLLGFCVDAEADGQPNAAASGDDLGFGAGGVGACADDEDGVAFTTAVAACNGAQVAVRVSAPALLDGWIDFGGDGTFGAGDQIFASTPVVAGVNTLGYTVPCTAVAGTTYARFRLSTGGGLGATGLAGDGEVEDYRLLILGNDWGDDPAPFPTTAAGNGARHVVDPAAPLFLGACVDSEGDGQPTAGADGDDLGAGAGTVGVCAGNDDEDGVAFTTPLIACQGASLTVVANAPGVLDGWLDWNRNDSWGDVGERFLAGQTLVAGANVFPVAVPCGAVPGAAYARFRFSSAGSTAPDGPAADGEVEDYVVALRGADYGDAPDTYGTTFGAGGPLHGVDPASGRYLGVCVDTELDGQPTVPAAGDDLGAGTSAAGSCAGNDDENGVLFDEPLVACRTAEVTVIGGPAGGLLDAWLDFDADGVFDTGDRIATAQAIAAGTNALVVNVPCTAQPGPTYARFRLSTVGVAGPGGAAGDGEVEDYWVSVHGVDFGDAPDSYTTVLASGGPSHAVDTALGPFLGGCVDTEADAGAPLDASGDDVTAGSSTAGSCAGNDDEDGVVFDTDFVACKVAEVTVTASAVGFLDAWLDFDADGSFAEAGDQIFASQPLGAGVNALTFDVPCTATEGTTYARFRFSTTGGLGIGGAAADGEVEDYVLLAQGADLGDAPDSYSTTVASGGPVHGVDPASTLFLGACVDTEDDAATPLDASGDDVTAGTVVVGSCAGSDDEDGVAFDTPVVACQSFQLTLTAGAAGMLDGWIDFGGDGSFTEPEDRVFTAEPLAAGSSVRTLQAPCTAVGGDTFARFRLSSAGGLGIGGSTPDGEVEDYPLTVRPVDFGDAPDSYGTTFGMNGPHHGVVDGFNLGTDVDTEDEGQPSTGANGDGADEDGVAFAGGMAMATACDAASVTVTLTNTAGVGTPLLDAWIDFDGDGAFDDPRDRIAAGVALVDGANDVAFTVPCDARSAASYARFRLSGLGVANARGPAADGEVEDYAFTVKGLDFGDAPDPTYPTLLASNGARHAVLPAANPTLGAAVDTEADGQPSPNHNGDDQNGSPDDEDGVAFPAVLIPGIDGAVEVATGATGGLVSAWIDFNQDGDWLDAGEQILVDTAVGASQTVLLSFPVPVGSLEGTACTRFRISTEPGLGPSGPAADGEVEDHLAPVGVEEPAIGVAKRLVSVVREDETTFLATFEVMLENAGNVPLFDVNATADFATAFAAAERVTVAEVTSDDFTVNPSFDGATDILLLAPGNTLAVGASGRLLAVVRVEPGGNPGPYLCSSVANGTSPAGNEVTDVSQDGADPDSNQNGDPSDDSDPTIISFDVDILDIPVLDARGLALLTLLLAAGGLWRMRRRRA